MKKLNFDKWMNIWLIIILGLHTLSLITNLIVLKVAGDTMTASLPDPALINYMPNFAFFSGAGMMLLMIVVHVVSAAFMVGIAYLVLRQLSKE